MHHGADKRILSNFSTACPARIRIVIENSMRLFT
jgi:hypothetical protein